MVGLCSGDVMCFLCGTDWFCIYYLEENAEMVAKFHVATACFSCSPPDLNLSKLSSPADKATTIIFSKLH
jgi:hypothetical protein